jgi:hypothetical protein
VTLAIVRIGEIRLRQAGARNCLVRGTRHRPPVRDRLLIASLLAVFLGGCLGGPSHADTKDNGPSSEAVQARDVVWNPRLDGGDLALRFNLTSPTQNHCLVLLNSTGVITSPGPALFYMAEGAETPRMDYDGGQRDVRSYVHVGAGPVDEVVSTPVVPFFPHRFYIGSGHSYDLDASHSVRFTLAFRSLSPPGPSERSPLYSIGNGTILLHIRCSGPILLNDLEASREAFFFNEASFSGGAGVHYDDWDPTGATLAGSVKATVSSARGLLALRCDGDLFGIRGGGGIVQVTTPTKSDLLVSKPGPMLVWSTAGLADERRFFESTAGDYRVDATFASATITARLSAVVLGLNPVPSLVAVAPSA